MNPREYSHGSVVAGFVRVHVLPVGLGGRFGHPPNYTQEVSPESRRELQQESVPQLSALFLCFSDDVRLS